MVYISDILLKIRDIVRITTYIQYHLSKIRASHENDKEVRTPVLAQIGILDP